MPDEHYTLTQLKNERGWTDTIVRKLLGAPDATRPNSHCGSAAPVRLYLQARVNAIEQSEEWAALAQKASARRAAAEKATQTKRESLLKYCESLLKYRESLLECMDALNIHVSLLPIGEATCSSVRAELTANQNGKRGGPTIKRTALSDGSGRWFNREKSEHFDEATWWNRFNEVSLATGNCREHERLYRTESGQWILFGWTQYESDHTTYNEIDDADAAAWLVRNSHEPHAACVEQFATLEIT